MVSTEGDLRWLRLGTGGAGSEAANEHCMKSGLRRDGLQMGKAAETTLQYAW